MNKNTARIVVAISALVLGALSLYGVIDSTYRLYSTFIALAIFVIGILLLLPNIKSAEKGLIIASLVLFIIQIPRALFMGIFSSTMRMPLSLLNIIPIIYAVLYLTTKESESEVEESHDTGIPHSHYQDISAFDASRLRKVQVLYDKGLITRDEYEKKRREILK